MARISATERSATRARLIDAAKREFAERGLAGARFDEIALSAGHAKGTIYNYFPSKEALFFTIVAEWCQHLADAIDAQPSDGSAHDRLIEIAALDVEIARKDPDLARVVVQQMPSLATSHAHEVDAATTPGLDRLAGIFAAGCAAGAFSPDHEPAVLARLFLATLSAYELEALMPAAGVDLDDVVVLVERHFLAGLAPHNVGDER